ncbi:MAG: diaminopimelate dehydrogenase [Lentisphaeria bacterium]
MSKNKKKRVAIVGYGNVGRGAIMAINNTPDMELAGIISRSPERVKKSLSDSSINVYPMCQAESAIQEMQADIAILCGGSKKDLPEQGPVFAQFINTVDSYDNHSCIPQYFAAMDSAASASKHLAVISTGWDPGVFSLERVLANSFLAGAKPYGFYGLKPQGGLSMGHSDALRTIPGIKDARQFTHAIPAAIEKVKSGTNPTFKPGDMHTRECYVVLEENANKDKIIETIKTMPGYFEPYKTTINFVSEEELLKKFGGFPHDGCVVASSTTGVESAKHSANIEYRCSWGSNPEATGNILVAHARACMRLAKDGRTGAATILDIPAAYFSPFTRDELLKNLM